MLSVSHLRPEDREAFRGQWSCRKGRHLYGESKKVGGGILRRVCEACGEVTIDLTVADELTTPLVRRPDKVSSLAKRDTGQKFA